jgi:hypothetical protein
MSRDRNKVKNSTNLNNVEELYAQSFVWDAHAGVFPNPAVDLNLLNE